MLYCGHISKVMDCHFGTAASKMNHAFLIILLQAQNPLSMSFAYFLYVYPLLFVLTYKSYLNMQKATEKQSKAREAAIQNSDFRIGYPQITINK